MTVPTRERYHDAEDLLDFTIAFLERQFTEPTKLALASARRAQRRQQKP
jgi:hypothetical protein